MTIEKETALSIDNIQRINNYKIRFNTLFNEWIVSCIHEGCGEDFKTLEEAIYYAERG